MCSATSHLLQLFGLFLLSQSLLSIQEHLDRHVNVIPFILSLGVIGSICRWGSKVGRPCGSWRLHERLVCLLSLLLPVVNVFLVHFPHAVDTSGHAAIFGLFGSGGTRTPAITRVSFSASSRRAFRDPTFPKTSSALCWAVRLSCFRSEVSNVRLEGFEGEKVFLWLAPLWPTPRGCFLCTWLVKLVFGGSCLVISNPSWTVLWSLTIVENIRVLVKASRGAKPSCRGLYLCKTRSQHVCVTVISRALGRICFSGGRPVPSLPHFLCQSAISNMQKQMTV